MGGTATDDTRSHPTGETAAGRFVPGTVVGARYRIVRFIAAGGVGEVYEAEDLLLGGRVALKALRGDLAGATTAGDRLRREIALARKVTHPNVCRVHELGEHEGRMFLTMELIRGETLAARLRHGPFAMSLLVAVARDLVEALAALHAAGVMHRDFKSANVLLAEDGRVVVTDFGLARSTTPGDPSITADGGLLGTLAYMAPEQVLGQPATPASDIYALGVVLFEMATGSRPFEEETPLATATARLSRPPPRPRERRPDLDAEWEARILKCLAREPASRFARVEDILDAPVRPGRTRRGFLIGGAAVAALGASAIVLGRNLAGPTVAPRRVRRLALVPTADQDRVLDEDPLALVLFADLYDALAGLGEGERRLDILGPQTALELRRRGSDADSASAIADATARVSVTSAGGTLTIAVEGSSPGRANWTAVRSGPDSDAPVLVDLVARDIARGLAAPPPRRPSDAAPIAAGLYARYADALLGERTLDATLLEAVLDAAPRFTRARRRLAGLLIGRYYSRTPDLAILRRARDEADRAIAEDPEACAAYGTRGIASMALWEWDAADADTGHALALAPGHQRSVEPRSTFLMNVTRFDEAITLARRIVELDPLSADAMDGLGWCMFMARRHHEAVPVLLRSIELQRNAEKATQTLGFVAVAQAEQSHFEAALATAQRVLARKPSTYTMAQIATVYASAGRRTDAMALLERVERDGVHPFMLAWLRAALGDIEGALPLLTRIVDEHDPHAVLLKIAFLPQPLRADPRFDALMRRVGFPT